MRYPFFVSAFLFFELGTGFAQIHLYMKNSEFEMRISLKKAVSTIILYYKNIQSLHCRVFHF